MSGASMTILVGKVALHPVSTTTSAGLTMTTLSIVTDESWIDRVSGERKKHTELHLVKLYGRKAEFARDHLKKGSRVHVNGRNRTERFQHKGEDRSAFYVLGDRLVVLGLARKPPNESFADIDD